jgi:hypothetical protein
MKCKWYNTRKMPTYLYLRVESGPTILVGFEEVPIDRKWAPSPFQSGQVV